MHDRTRVAQSQAVLLCTAPDCHRMAGFYYWIFNSKLTLTTTVHLFEITIIIQLKLNQHRPGQIRHIQRGRIRVHRQAVRPCERTPTVDDAPTRTRIDRETADRPPRSRVPRPIDGVQKGAVGDGEIRMIEIDVVDDRRRVAAAQTGADDAALHAIGDAQAVEALEQRDGMGQGEFEGLGIVVREDVQQSTGGAESKDSCVAVAVGDVELIGNEKSAIIIAFSHVIRLAIRTSSVAATATAVGMHSRSSCGPHSKRWPITSAGLRRSMSRSLAYIST